MIETTRPELTGNVGMAASTHWLASSTAMSILEGGGNAADAAAAGGFVLQVVEPHLNGPGGEVPILLWDDSANSVRVIAGQGSAPAGADPKQLKALGLDLMPGTGLLPTVIPGAFGAWMLLVEEYGTLSVQDVLEPAIHYAEKGHPFLQSASEAVASVGDMFSAHWPSSASLWLPDGRVPKKNQCFRNPTVAETYKRIIVEAKAVGPQRSRQFSAAVDAWYRGFVAEAIGKFSTESFRDSSGESHSGWMSADDLASWSPTIEDPVTFDYANYTVCKTKPWGQGPVLLQQLALLESFDLDSMTPGSEEWVHTILEASKLAFADREAWYGDPEFTDVPLADLLSLEYSVTRRELIGRRASLELRPGSPGGRRPRLAGDLTARRPGAANGTGEPKVAANGEVRGDTCHIDVVDSDGMMISATPSGGWLQSSPTIPELGFSLSTRGQMFFLDEGLPNTLRPGARPRTTLTPSFALRDGEPWLAFGTPGGDAQDQWSLQLFLNLVHGNMNLQQAIDAPAFHSTHFPSSFYPRESYPARVILENRFAPDVLRGLEHRGHEVVVGGSWSEGRLSAVAREDGWLKAAANPRGAQGYAVGR